MTFFPTLTQPDNPHFATRTLTQIVTLAGDDPGDSLRVRVRVRVSARVKRSLRV